jgi:hypothetical protein
MVPGRSHRRSVIGGPEVIHLKVIVRFTGWDEVTPEGFSLPMDPSPQDSLVQEGTRASLLPSSIDVLLPRSIDSLPPGRSLDASGSLSPIGISLRNPAGDDGEPGPNVIAQGLSAVSNASPVPTLRARMNAFHTPRQTRSLTKLVSTRQRSAVRYGRWWLSRFASRRRRIRRPVHVPIAPRGGRAACCLYHAATMDRASAIDA